MKIKVLYFANVKEQLDLAEEVIQLPHDQTVAELCRQLAARGGIWQQIFDSADSLLKMAVNQEIVSPEADLTGGDEVAFFPPVTGG